MLTNIPKYTIDDLYEYLGYTGSLQDREQKFLSDLGYPTWEKFLTAKGYTKGCIAARQQQWVRDNLLVNPASRRRGVALKGQDVTFQIAPV